MTYGTTIYSIHQFQLSNKWIEIYWYAICLKGCNMISKNFCPLSLHVSFESTQRKHHPQEASEIYTPQCGKVAKNYKISSLPTVLCWRKFSVFLADKEDAVIKGYNMKWFKYIKACHNTVFVIRICASYEHCMKINFI